MTAEAISTENEGTSYAHWGLWGIQVLLAVAFLFAARGKLSGDPHMVAVFEKIGVGAWFRYLTGGLELAGAVGLVIPGVCGLAAAGLAIVMVGAVCTHLFILGPSAVPAVVFLVLLLVIVYGRRNQFAWLGAPRERSEP